MTITPMPIVQSGLQSFHRQGDANMRNKIIENAIDSVVNASNTSSDFKLAFRQYVKTSLMITPKRAI